MISVLSAGTRLFVAPRVHFVPCFSLAIVAFMALVAAAETPLTTLRSETRDLLREEAVAADGSEKDAAIAALCDMYVILRYDDRYENSEMLKGDAAKIRRRLLTIARRRENRLNRENVSRPSSLSTEIESAIQSALSGDDKEGGVASLGGQAAGGLPDEGWRLVELIERIIAPDFWENRGGPGAIHYFAMRKVLVVRATTDVHEQIKDLLRALR